jgi:anti-anti-sigma factor
MSGLPRSESLNTEPRTVITWPQPDVAVVVLEGEHDLESAPRLEQALGEALVTCSHLVVDLSLAQFIDSSTIHVLVTMKNEADNHGCRFTLVLEGSPSIEHTLEICGVLEALNRVPTLDAALRNGGSSVKSLADNRAVKAEPQPPMIDAASTSSDGRTPGKRELVDQKKKKKETKWTVLCRRPSGEPNGSEVVALPRISLNRTPAVGQGLFGRIVTEVHADEDPPTVIVEPTGRG